MKSRGDFRPICPPTAGRLNRLGFVLAWATLLAAVTALTAPTRVTAFVAAGVMVACQIGAIVCLLAGHTDSDDSGNDANDAPTRFTSED